MFMNFFEKTDKLNHLYSYNVFAFSCIIATILFSIPLLYPSIMDIFINISDNFECKAAMIYIIWNIFFSICLLIAFIFFLLEKDLKLFIKRDFIINNKYIKYFRYLCAFISLFCAMTLIIVVLYISISKIFTPNDLIYYNIHSK